MLENQNGPVGRDDDFDLPDDAGDWARKPTVLPEDTVDIWLLLVSLALGPFLIGLMFG